MSTDTNTAPQVTGHLLLFRGTNWSEGLPDGEIRQAMDKMGAWFDRLTAEGKMVSAQPLFDESVLISGKGGRAVTDGPFAEAKEVVGGYVLLSVDTMEEAVALAQSNPLHDYGLVTEVRATATACPHLHRVFSRLAAAAA